MEAEFGARDSRRVEPAWARQVSDARRHATPAAITGAAVAGALLLLYLPAFAHAVDVWRLDATLSFGFFGPPAAALLLFLRRREIRTAVSSGSRLGLPLVVSGLVLFVVGRASGVHAITAVSLLPTGLGAAAYVFGFRVAVNLAAPIGLLTATLSLYFGMLNNVGFKLQEITAIGASDVAGALGTPVVRTGVDLFVGHNHFIVAQACSGMNSLVALLFLGLVAAAFLTISWAGRIALLASAIPIVLVTNVARVSLVLITSGVSGFNLESGPAHAVLSAGMFVIAASLFVTLGFALGRLPRLDAQSS